MLKKNVAAKTRRNWRIAGVMCLVVALLMAMYSPVIMRTTGHWFLPMAYWAVFLAALLVALYIALLDIRLTRVQYKMRERELFHDTFMTDEFRRELDAARARKNNEDASGN